MSHMWPMLFLKIIFYSFSYVHTAHYISSDIAPKQMDAYVDVCAPLSVIWIYFNTLQSPSSHWMVFRKWKP